jgi:siroheme synthase
MFEGSGRSCASSQEIRSSSVVRAKMSRLRQATISFEIVPGITAAHAVVADLKTP